MVFCKDCIYNIYDDYDSCCGKVIGYKDTPYKRRKVYAEEKISNQKNKCEHYEERKKFLGIF